MARLMVALIFLEFVMASSSCLSNLQKLLLSVLLLASSLSPSLTFRAQQLLFVVYADLMISRV